jgi:hypothetical protein
MKKIVLAAAAAASLAVSACAVTPTPYQPAGLPGARASGGFSELQLEGNRFRVNFTGNSYTDRQTVENGLLLRAAELTLAQGYDWFSTVERDTEVRTRYRDYGFNRSAFGYGPYWSPYWRYYGRYGWSGFYDPFGWDRDVDIREIRRYEASSEIVMGRGPKPAADPRAFDAREVVARVGPMVPRPYYAGVPARY